MTGDPATLAVYAAQAAAYAARRHKDEDTPALTRFMAALPPGARVLDLGCGSGHAAARMQTAGLRPEASDASPQMVALAQAAGVDARVETFDRLSAEAAYDGIWANFSLLHAPRAAFPGHLAAIARALVPGGVLHIGMKTGTGEGRDRLGRFYTYYPADHLADLLAAAGLAEFSRHAGSGTGFDGAAYSWVILLARKPA